MYLWLDWLFKNNMKYRNESNTKKTDKKMECSRENSFAFHEIVITTVQIFYFH
jgi:hypothetical protein